MTDKENKSRLGRQNWLEAARAALHEKGLEGVKVERLARALGVSKGSFYWHFKNRDALLEGLLAFWEESTGWLIEEASLPATPREKLGHLFHLIGTLGVSGEAALFTWAKQDQDVRARIMDVEKKRVAFLRGLFVEDGFSVAEAERRAQVGYLAFQGYVHRLDPETSESFDALGEALLSLLFQDEVKDS